MEGDPSTREGEGTSKQIVFLSQYRMDDAQDSEADDERQGESCHNNVISLLNCALLLTYVSLQN
jgi:hypothetical protein